MYGASDRSNQVAKTRQRILQTVYSAAEFGRIEMSLGKWIVVATIIVAAPVLAHEVEEETGPVSPWAGKARLGYLATSGNTDNSSLAGAFEISYSAEKWAHFFEAATFEASQSNVTTAEAYSAGWKSERALAEFSYLFGRLDWRKDRFSGYDKQFSQTLGYGHRLIDIEKHSLNGELGLGARQSDLADGRSESETILTGGLYYIWSISENAEFTQDLLVEVGDENTFFQSKTAVSATLVGNLALVASYTIKNNSKVPLGNDKTDTFTAVSFEYSF
jgi:putative salt-induced outer membrane protein